MQDAQPWMADRDVLPVPPAPRRSLGRRGVDPAEPGRQRRLGRVLVDLGVPVSTVEAALAGPSTDPLARLGERMVADGSLTPDVVDTALALQECPLELALAPTDAERSSYLSRGRWIVPLQAAALAGGAVLVLRLAQASLWLLPVAAMLALTALSFLLGLNATLAGHGRYASDLSEGSSAGSVSGASAASALSWRPSVDVLLPTCGEDLTVLDNTWRHVMGLRWGGPLRVLVLDDVGRPEVAQLARHYGFDYLARPTHESAKAGNLLYGFERSAGELVAVLDADAAPRDDFLLELVPHLDDPTVGIVQTPKYVDVSRSQGWVQRGAGALQEPFSRHTQQGRSALDAAVCVGSNAVYRRSALDLIGGPGEDVHTGFRMMGAGWRTVYVPLVLTKGLSPAGLRSYFHQQHRSCTSSMSLVRSRRFWATSLTARQRLCFAADLAASLSTALWTFLVPMAALLVVWLVPSSVTIGSYLLLLPAALTTCVLVPLWHRASYSPLAVARVRAVAGYAQLLALANRPGRYEAFRRLHLVWSALLVGGLLGGVGLRLVQGYGPVSFLPVAGYAALQAYQAVRIRLAMREPARVTVLAPVVPAQRASVEALTPLTAS